MSRSVSFVLVVLLGVSLAACSPPAPDPAADRQQIAAAAERIWSAVARTDAVAVLAEYGDDAMILGAGGPAVTGKPAVAAFLSDLFGEITFRDVVGTPTDITVSGDLGVETGTYSWTIVPPEGSPVDDRGKYLHVWARTPDGWKVVRYMSNSDLPSP